MKLPVVGGTYTAYSTAENAQRCVNWFPSPDPLGVNNNGYVLNPTPGQREALSSSGEIRGAHWMDGVHYIVQGTSLYEVNGTLTSLGTVAGSGRVSMSDDGFRLTITTGANGYQYSVVGGFISITDADFNSLYQHNKFLAGYTIYAGGNQGQFQISSPYASDEIDGLDFATAETAPDDIVGFEVNDRLLYFFGEDGTEVWQLSGGFFPFTLITGAYIERGCIAQWSITKLDGRIFWLGDDLNVYFVRGYERFSVTPPGIAEIIRDQPRPEDAYGYGYIQGGHAFYCLTFDDVTIVYDIVTKQWHERGTWSNTDHSRWQVTHLTDNDGVIYAYSDSGSIYTLDPDYFLDGTQEIIRDRITQDISGEGPRRKQREIQFLVDPGQGLEDNVTPYLQLRWSDDQGYTWSNEHWLSIGKVGEYRNRARKTRLGSFLKTRRYWVRSSSPVKAVIQDCWGEFV